MRAALLAVLSALLLVNTYHHLRDRERWFRGLAAWLRPGGRLAIINFTPESPTGPPKAARVPAERVRAELARAGWVLVAEPLPLSHQFFHVYRPGG